MANIKLRTLCFCEETIAQLELSGGCDEIMVSRILLEWLSDNGYSRDGAFYIWIRRSETEYLTRVFCKLVKNDKI